MLHQVGASTIDGAVYTVDPAGNRTAKTDEHANVTSNYTYDPLYELTQVMQSTTTTETYSYDPVGNRLSSLGVSPYSVNTSNELTAIPGTTYTYDSNGNTLTKVTSSGTTTFGWDYENRLTSVTLPGTGGTLAFKYDGLGRRVEKAFTQGSTTTTTNYLYDGNNAVSDVDQNGNVLARYVATQNIDEPLAELQSSTTSFYSQDGLGSVTSLTTSAGGLGNTYTYDSFGKLTASTGSAVNRFQYTGREADLETGLYFYRARYYDPSAGRFLSEDPIRFAAGSDFYKYVNNLPANNSDPSGLAPGCSTNCLPRGDLPLDLRLQLKLMSLASKLTDVTYYVGAQGSYTFTNGGFGASAAGGVGYATDPEGNEGLVYSLGGGATLGTPGGEVGLQIGGATYQNISGFSGNSFGQEAGGGSGLIVGGGLNTNSSGVFTYANVGVAALKNVDYSPSTISNAVKIILICP